MSARLEVPELGWLGLLLIVAVVVAEWRFRSGPSGQPFAPFASLRTLPMGRRERFAALPRFSLFVVGALLVLAVAGPTVSRSSASDRGRELEPTGVVLAVDRSSSMRFVEGSVSRASSVQTALTRFVRRHRDTAFGVVGFARFPRLDCPVTTDTDHVLEVLSTLDPRSPALDGGADDLLDGTGIGAAVARAVLSLEQARVERGTVVVLTDGRETEAVISPRAASDLAAESGVRVHAIGVGAAFEAIDADDAVAVLEEIVGSTGGTVRVAAEPGSLAAALSAIEVVEKAGGVLGAGAVETRFSLSAPVLALAFMIACFGLWAEGGWLRRERFDRRRLGIVPLRWVVVLTLAAAGLALVDLRSRARFEDSVDWCVAIDASRSMADREFASGAGAAGRSRLDLACADLVALARQLPRGDRVALSAVGSDLQTLCPITLDHDAFVAVLSGAGPRFRPVADRGRGEALVPPSGEEAGARPRLVLTASADWTVRAGSGADSESGSSQQSLAFGGSDPGAVVDRLLDLRRTQISEQRPSNRSAVRSAWRVLASVALLLVLIELAALRGSGISSDSGGDL